MSGVSGDFRVLLQQELVARCRANPAYSLRAFAKRLGVEPSALSKVLNRKRAVTPRFIADVGPRLGLPADRVTAYVRNYADDSSYRALALDQFKLISDWYHFAILELMNLREFSAAPEWIAAKLGIGERTAGAAVRRLVRLGILEKTESGILRNVRGSHTTIGNAGTAAAFRKLQKQILKQSIRAIEEVPIERRDHSAVTIAIDAERIPQVKARIKKFRRELGAFVQRSGRPLTEVYQISIGFFPVTKGRSNA